MAYDIVSSLHLCCHSNTKARDSTRQEVNFSVNQPEETEPVLDFTLNSSENELQLDEDIFSGFCAEEYEYEKEGK